jgi:hypothetical protein
VIVIFYEMISTELQTTFSLSQDEYYLSLYAKVIQTNIIVFPLDSSLFTWRLFLIAGLNILKINIHPNCTYIAYKTSCITANTVRVHQKHQPVNTVQEHNRRVLRESHETQICRVENCRVFNQFRNGGGHSMANGLRVWKELEKPDTMYDQYPRICLIQPRHTSHRNADLPESRVFKVCASENVIKQRKNVT